MITNKINKERGELWSKSKARTISGGEGTWLHTDLLLWSSVMKMGSILPRVRRFKVVTLKATPMKKLLIRQSGSHAVYRHPDRRWATVPIHTGEDAAKGVLRKILKDTRLTVEEFESL